MTSSLDPSLIDSAKFRHSGHTISLRKAIVISDNNSIHKESLKGTLRHSLERPCTSVFQTKYDSDLVTIDLKDLN